ncbi:MAG: UDP-glucose/GDP-mannose dehydrogenase family protein [Bacteroidia bacterium]|nr:UDP-glucose/GDP-mannose dehydrogenase family protein [Bacteroidia bacterium]
MNITIVGTGYVGLVTGACLAELGNTLYCVDTDAAKIASLQGNQIPMYEPGLQDLVERNQAAGRLHFTTSLAEGVGQAQVLFIAVGTPPNPDGSANLEGVENVAQQVGKLFDHPLLVVNKSTVPVGTGDRVKAIIASELSARGVEIPFDVASNPEFLKEGSAVKDFMQPDRVVVGADSPWAQELMAALYKPMLLSNFRVIFMDIRSAEMTKYAANAMLAVRISFMNEVANLCEKVGADVSLVRQGMGSDPRIGAKFLYPGCGYGGSCFPKDVKALIHTAGQNGLSMQLLEATEAVNSAQKKVLFSKFYSYFNGEVHGRRVAVWGLAFKPGTDDMREAPSITLIEQLLGAGCAISAYDPAAIPEARRLFGDRIAYAATPYEAVQEADALFHVTEWKDYRMPNWQQVRTAMRIPLIIDGRNVFDREVLEGFTYLRIGS